jgi:hypothetical protein
VISFRSAASGGLAVEIITIDLKGFLTLLDMQISRIESLKDYTAETEDIDLEAAELRTSVPLDATGKLNRDEADLERQPYRAMAELDRLQMRRKGEKGPPEVRVYLTREVLPQETITKRSQQVARFH